MSRAALARHLGVYVLATLAFVPTLGQPSVGIHAAQARERVAFVSVVDEKTGAPVTDVTARTIAIREDGNAREILKIGPATTPMAVALVVDNSQAAAPTIPDLRKATETFVRTLDGVGPIAIFTVADRPTVVQSYTTSQKDLLAAAGRLFHAPSSGATLLDTIADVSRGLARREEERAAIVVVTGENTDFSNLHHTQVLEALKESGAMLSALVLTNPQASFAAGQPEQYRSIVLDRGPRETGGARIDVLASQAFEERLTELARALNAQQRVVYARPESLIPPEKFEVTATAPGLKAFGAPARRQEAK